jgi:hypothetical protein
LFTLHELSDFVAVEKLTLGEKIAKPRQSADAWSTERRAPGRLSV